MDKIMKTYVGKLSQVGGDDQHLEAWSSPPTEDRDGEIVLPSSANDCVDAFVRTGVILAGHKTQADNGRSLVVAKPQAASIDPAKGIWWKGEIAPTELAREHALLAKRGFLGGTSIGFMPIQGEYLVNRDGTRGPYVHTKIELLEISLVAIPSNRDALIGVRGKEVKAATVDELLKTLDAQPESTEGVSLKSIAMLLCGISKRLDGLEKMASELQAIKAAMGKAPGFEAFEAKLYEILGDVLAKDFEKGRTEPDPQRVGGDQESGSETLDKAMRELAATLQRAASEFGGK